MEGKGPGEKRETAPKKAAESERIFLVSSSPHLHDGRTVPSVMKLVLWALLPASLFSIYAFGFDALRVILISTVSAAALEAASRKMMRRESSVGDFSAVLTGLLLALNLPPTVPWWMIVVGNIFAIVIAKQIYGGLGYNPFNPALVGRVVLLVSFPVHMTARWVTAAPWGVDAVTTATPLGMARDSLARLGRIEMQFGREEIVNLLVGTRAGCIGEVSVILLLAGGLFLLWKKVISWHAPVAFIGTVWAVTGIFHLADPSRYADPAFHVISGGLFLGAIFMATDYVTTPIAKSGMLIFGFGCGLITVVIRLFGGFPEGVSFAILLMNAATPLIDKMTKPAVFGRIEKKKAAA